jgi:hypothetical protein
MANIFMEVTYEALAVPKVDIATHKDNIIPPGKPTNLFPKSYATTLDDKTMSAGRIKK